MKPPRKFYVYVILESCGVVYVGSTAHTPEERFRQHQNGKRFCRTCLSRHYAKHPVRLLAHLSRGPFTTRAHAERIERQVANKLRARELVVHGGH